MLFTLPEDYIPQVLQHMRKAPLEVDAYSRDDRTKLATGKLLTLNNEIDPTTGTNKYKAVFHNEDRALWPNQFVNMRLLLETKQNAITVPAAAIQRGNQGTFTYVVKPDNTVELRVVKVGVTEGNLASIESGLQPGELVVTDGQDKLQPGAKVEVQQRGNRSGGRRRTAERGARDHESVADFYSAAGRHLVADGGIAAGGPGGLPATAGFGACRRWITPPSRS